METQLSILDIIFRVATILVPIGAVFVGVGIERFKNRFKILDKQIEISKLGSSTNDPFYGEIQIKYEGDNVLNLSFITIELSNNSWTSLEQFDIKVGIPGDDIIILGNRAFLLFDSNTYTLKFSDSFNEQFNNVLNYSEEEKQQDKNYPNNLKYISIHREYGVPFLNKGQKILIELLVSSKDDIDNVILLPMKSNIKVRSIGDLETIKKNRFNIINTLSGVYFLITAFILYQLNINYREAIWYMVINSLTSYIFAWMTWFIIKFFKNFFIK